MKRAAGRPIVARVAKVSVGRGVGAVIAAGRLAYSLSCGTLDVEDLVAVLDIVIELVRISIQRPGAGRVVTGARREAWGRLRVPTDLSHLGYRGPSLVGRGRRRPGS